MRDIGTRIRRYRLSRYGSGDGRGVRRVRWLLPLLLVWLVYAGLLGEHSWFRIWRLEQESDQVRTDLGRTRAGIDSLEHRLNDPGASRAMGERVLRERSGFAGKDELIYRIPPASSDSLRP
jgi:cell division protein FtsB